MKINKKGQHAIDYAIYCTGWFFVRNDNFEDGYCFQDAPDGWVKADGTVTRLSIKQHYNDFLKTLKK